MKPINATLAILLMVIGLTSCDKENIYTDSGIDNLNYQSQNGLKAKKNDLKKATGSIELLWKGKDKGKGSEMGNKPEDLRVFFEFNAHEGNASKPPKGEIVYRVTEPDYSLHREIRAQVYAVYVLDGTNDGNNKAQFLAKVISDSKGCGGDSQGGHDSGCSDSDDGSCGDDHPDDGGCGDDDAIHDSGCSHEDVGDDGVTNDDEGCADNQSGEEGSETDHGSGSPGGGDKGNPLSGKNCRLGQIIAVKVNDLGTPGINGDHITWKWFSSTSEFEITKEIENLCKKTIIGGNLVVHK